MMEEIDLRELFHYFIERWIWIAVTIVVFLALGNFYLFIMRTPMYHSTTTILLASDNRNLLPSYSQLVETEPVLEPVVQKLGLNTTYNSLKKNISVKYANDTEVMSITVSYKDAKTAADIANEIASSYSTQLPKFYKMRSIKVVETAKEEAKPYNMNYLKMNVLFMFMAIALSCGTIFLLFYFDGTIKNSDAIENVLGLSVIGVIPKIEEEVVHEK